MTISLAYASPLARGFKRANSTAPAVNVKESEKAYMNNGRGHNAGNGNHNTPNRQIAQNTSGHHSGSGHFLRPDGSKRPEVERGGRR